MDRVDWVPVDILSEVILELAGVLQPQSEINGKYSYSSRFQSTKNAYSVYNIANPRAAPWSSLISTVNSYFLHTLKEVTWKQWLDALRQASQDATSATAKGNPGLKLLDFFELLESGAGETAPSLTMTETLASSPTLRGLSCVDSRWMELWLKQWAF